MSADSWGGRKTQQARELMARRIPAPCGRCNQIVDGSVPWVVGHIKSRAAYPELTWVVSNWQLEHKTCSDSSAQQAVIEKARRQALAEVGVSSLTEPARPSPHLPFSPLDTPKPLKPNPELFWNNPEQISPAWLHWLPTTLEDWSPPLYCTPAHPEATGSYGPEAEEYAREELGITLRHWQRFALYRALEHRADGSLCWRTVILSCARRSGKSVLLYVLLMYRITHGFEPDTEVVLTAGKAPQAKEIIRKGWRFADAHKADGWSARKANDSMEVETPDGNRLLLRPAESTAGYSPSLAVADEAWFIKPTFIDDDLAPSLLERVGGGQLWLVSTAHRRATSLMRGRLATALTAPDDRTLVLLWGAPEDADISDPAVWRAASPLWTQDRLETMQEAYTRALAGEVDLEADDPDPIAGFTCQLLNLWPLSARREIPGSPLTTSEDWSRLTTGSPITTPDAVAVESWFSEGVSVAEAFQQDGYTVVHTTDHPDLATAAQAVRTSGYTGTVIVGASLTTDPALRGIRTRPGTGRTAQAVQQISRLLQDDALRHTGEQHLSEQVLSVRTLPGADGPRLTSKGRADALKAAAWAVGAARKPSLGKPRILLAK